MSSSPFRDDRLTRLRVVRRAALDTLDLSDLGAVTPLDLVASAAIAHASVQGGREFRLIGPTSTSAGYAARMMLGRVVEDLGGVHDLPPPRVAQDHHDSLLELRAFTTGDEVRQLSALLRSKIEERDEYQAGKLHNSVAELGDNVCVHSRLVRAEAVGFMAAQALEQHGRILFAVADAGRGLLGSLASEGARDDTHAIKLALDGVSELRASGGQGLRETVSDVGSLGGALIVVSGRAVARTDGFRTVAGRLSHAFTGTMIEGRVGTKLPEKVAARPRR